MKEGIARLKGRLFNTCSSAIIQAVSDNRITSWAGMTNNPWLQAKYYKDKTTVIINQREFKVDPDDWDIVGDGLAVMYKIETPDRKYAMRVPRKKRGKYNKKPKVVEV